MPVVERTLKTREDVASFLTDLRGELTQDEYAALVGVSPESMKQYLTRRQAPPLERLAEIAEALGGRIVISADPAVSAARKAELLRQKAAELLGRAADLDSAE